MRQLNKHLLNVIEDYLQKNDNYTGMTSGLSNRLKGALNRLSYSKRGKTYEIATILDNEGNIIQTFTDDEPHSVIVNADDSYVDMNVHHNHPTKIRGSPTSLSVADCMKIMEFNDVIIDPDTGTGTLVFHWHSITADCSNGTRMTLTIKDKEKFSQYLLKDGAESYMSLVNGFCGDESKIDDYYSKLKMDYSDHMTEWRDANAGKYYDYDTGEWADGMDRHKFAEMTIAEEDKYLDTVRIDDFEDYIKDDIKAFDDVGLELTVGYLK